MLPGVEGRLGVLTADPETQRVFIAAPVAGTVEVIDLKTGQRVHTIGGLNRPQGLLYHVPSKRLFIATRGDATVSALDGRTYQVLNRAIFTGGDPDVLRASPTGKHILVGYGNGAIATIDINCRQFGDIRLDSHPADFYPETTGNRLWINLSASKLLVVADRSAKAVLRSWPVSVETSTGSNRAIAVDETNRRIFITTWRPARLAVLSADSGVRVDDRQTVNDPESISYDGANRRIYITGNDSFIDVVMQVSPDKYEPLTRVQTAPASRTSLFLPALARFCVAVPKSAGRNAELQVFVADRS